MSFDNHILFLTPGFPKDQTDFNCIPPLQEFLLQFKITFPTVEISVITFQYPYHKNNYKWNAISVYPLGGENSKLNKIFVWLKCLKTAMSINKISSINIIHSLWLGECAMLGAILSKRFNCLHICTLMGQDVKKSNRYLRILKYTKYTIVALSNNQAEQFFNITSRNVDDIIHWGIEDQHFTLSERDIDLLAVGSLIPLKNYSLFVKIIANLVKNGVDIRAVLVGDGPQRAELEELAHEFGVITNIEFRGLLNREDIFKLMQRSKIFVHPSLFEGSGYVFAEALGNGMNIVSFNVGYAQNNPKWFIVKDEEEFIKTLKKLLNNKLDFSPANIFPLKETIKRYASVYGIN